jgi:hypothetical protein
MDQVGHERRGRALEGDIVALSLLPHEGRDDAQRKAIVVCLDADVC